MRIICLLLLVISVTGGGTLGHEDLLTMEFGAPLRMSMLMRLRRPTEHSILMISILYEVFLALNYPTVSRNAVHCAGCTKCIRPPLVSRAPSNVTGMLVVRRMCEERMRKFLTDTYGHLICAKLGRKERIPPEVKLYFKRFRPDLAPLLERCNSIGAHMGGKKSKCVREVFGMVDERVHALYLEIAYSAFHLCLEQLDYYYYHLYHKFVALLFKNYSQANEAVKSLLDYKCSKE